MKRISMVILVSVAILATAVLSAEPPTMQVRVSFEDPLVPRTLQGMGFDVVYKGDDFIDVFVRGDGLSRLRSLGYQVEVIHEDVEEFYVSRLDGPEPFGGYKTLSQIYAYLDDMKAAHPDIMTDRISIGQTIEGRDIYAVKISDNPDVDEDEPEVFFNSIIHACEVMPGEVLLYFMNYLTDNYGTDPEATDIVDNREVWFVLVINPDGYYYNEVIRPNGGGNWRKNRRDNLDGTFGVDLNRNFGVGWGVDDYGSSPYTDEGNYRGTGPFSEPEAQGISDFIASRNFVLSLDYHGYGEFLIWPWGYTALDPPDEDLLRDIVDSLASYNGYTIEFDWAVNGCQKDWSYGDQHVLSIVIEVGNADDGFWPKSDRIPEIAAQNLGVNLFMCRVADSVYSLAAPKRPEMHAPEGPQGPDFSISWSDLDTDNPGVQYELLELEEPAITIDYLDDLDNWLGIGLGSYYYYSAPTSFGLGGWRDHFAWAKEPVYVAHGDSVKFWTLLNLHDGYAYAYVEVSTDGINYESIPGNLTTNDNPFGYNLGNGITGASADWVRAEFDLGAYQGENLWLRFMVCPNIQDYQNPVFSAIQIDDIEFFKEFSTQTIIASDITDTGFDFTGKPENDYYYRVRSRDAQDQWGKFSNYGLVTVTGGTSYVCGDANGDGHVTQADVMFLIEYLHKDGPAPDPYEAGDANGDGIVDKLDAKYLIEYLHKDGPEPVCP